MTRNSVWMVLPVLLLLVACVLTPVTPPVDEIPLTPTPTAAEPTLSPTATPLPVAAKINVENLTTLQAENFDLPTWPAALLWPEEQRLLVVTNEDQGGLRLWELYLSPLRVVPQNELLYPAEVNVAGSVLAFAPDGSSMAVSAGDVLEVRRLDGTLLFSLPSPGLYGAEYDAGGEYLVSTSQTEWRALVWNVRSGQQLGSLTGFETAAPVYGVRLSPGARWAVWGARATLMAQELQSANFTAHLSYSDFVMDVDFLPNATQMVVLVEGQWRLVDLATGGELRSCPAAGVSELAVSPDGQLLVGSGSGQTVFWGMGDCTPLATLPEQVSRLSFSPDGRALVGVLQDGLTLRVWSVR
ncbi:MAG: hypothetical protein KA988_03290 [Longilinea sp.]|nr:hypothetical protein [Longilinea sp.]